MKMKTTFCMSSDQLLSKKWILCRGRGIYPKVPPAARKHSKGSPGSADHFMYPRFGNVCPLVGYPARDEVIVPSFTFVSTANPFVLSGAHIRFSDIHPDTLNLDENQLENLDTPRTRAVSVKHYAGVGCEMDRIIDIAQRYGALL